MAPEYLAHGDFSLCSDIWALGCVIYELVMLRNPFFSVKVSVDIAGSIHQFNVTYQ